MWIKTIFKKKKKRKHLHSWECYGGFSIWEGSCETFGHFWDCETKEEAFDALLGLLERFKKEKNWTEEEYQKHLRFNLKLNDIEDLYKGMIKKQRKEKLEKINDRKRI